MYVPFNSEENVERVEISERMTILKILDLIGLLISTVNWAQTSQTSIKIMVSNWVD